MLSSSSIFHGVGSLVDPFRSHTSRSLFNGLPWFLLPAGEYCFITLGNLLRGILFTWCIQFLLYSCSVKVAILPLDLLCSGPVTHSGEILTTGKSHGKKLDSHVVSTSFSVFPPTKELNCEKVACRLVVLQSY